MAITEVFAGIPIRDYAAAVVWYRRPAVRFTACSRGEKPGRTGWPGGLVVDRPRCATLTVKFAGEAPVRRRVPLGRRC